ncbi:MAG TPA: hypothetical protein VJ914_06110 [Pseudonocardiaceae bacterium]|nr:hypothetical protein [Pseudonocardiaceae bacterium]
MLKIAKTAALAAALAGALATGLIGLGTSAQAAPAQPNNWVCILKLDVAARVDHYEESDIAGQMYLGDTLNVDIGTGQGNGVDWIHGWDEQSGTVGWIPSNDCGHWG